MISGHIEQLLHFFAERASWVYLIAVVAAVVEGAAFAGLVFPSETVLLIAGATTIHHTVHLSLLIAIATIGAVIGDSVGYAIGHKLGPRLRTSRLTRRVSAHQWRRSEDLIHRRGWLAVFIGRFISILRSLVPALAGALHMPYRRFFVGNFLGAVIWTPLVLLAGHFAAHNLRGVEHVITRSGWTLLSFFALVGVLISVKLRRDRARDGVRDQTP